MNDWTLAIAMIDRLEGLSIAATKKVISLHKKRKPPCAHFVAVHQVIEGMLHEALTRQRQMMLSESKN